MKPVIYQLIVRYFSNTNLNNIPAGNLAENGCGRFEDINERALAALEDFGITHLWLTGVIRHSTLTDYSALGLPADDPDIVKGIAGSFYGIRDYFDVSPDYAREPANRMAEFQDLVARIHGSGLKVLLDLVPNHVARCYHSVVHPELDFGAGDDQSRYFARDNHHFYCGKEGEPLRLTRPAHWNPGGMPFDGLFGGEDGSAGHRPKASGDTVSVQPSSGSWYETVKLNYGFDPLAGTSEYNPRPRTWDQMDRVVAYWQDKGVDGFRCDMAHMVPREFWEFLTSRARERDANSYFLAEAYPSGNSPDPIKTMPQLVEAGFDAVYNDVAYDTLKRIYNGTAGQGEYDRLMAFPPIAPHQLLNYLENHDELRIPAGIVGSGDPGSSGFGSHEAGFHLAPLQYLYSSGPVMILNGQEVGEKGGNGDEGFHDTKGRTTFFDYWSLPELAKWVNGHAYDGGFLSQGQKELRDYYRSVFKLCQSPAVLATGYWGLKYFNRPGEFAGCPEDLYSFARFGTGSGELMIAVANFRPNMETSGRIGAPAELIAAAALPALLRIYLVLDRRGEQRTLVAELTDGELRSVGFPVAVGSQTTNVYMICDGGADSMTPHSGLSLRREGAS